MNKRLESILPEVSKPSRYAGGEYKAVYKEKSRVDLRFALCFPDIYEVGMSHLGSRILYGLLNSKEGVWCERAYTPWPDMEEKLRCNGIDLYALESGDSLRDFDILGFSLQYELNYTNMLNMLDMCGIPLFSKDRQEMTPLVIAGGPCVYNPEPAADFLDIVLIGDGEEIILEIAELYRTAKKEKISKSELLRRASRIPGAYVPSLYEIVYHDDGTIAQIAAKDGAPEIIVKRVVEDLDKAYYPDFFAVNSTQIVFDRAMIELFRGCGRGCRFCQAGYTYRPIRMKKPETLLNQAKKLIESTGYEELSLSSLSTSDYTGLKTLCDALLEYCEPKRVSLSLPSLRADNFSIDLMQKVQSVRKSGLTFAPEAGTQRLRDAINKNLSEEDLLAACGIAFAGGWNRLKLYFMIGLPGETLEDLEGIRELVQKVLSVWRRSATNRRHGVKITVSASSFVPKPHTPFQWERQNTVEELTKKQEYLRCCLNMKNVAFKWHDADTSFIEAAFSRGGRRLSAVLYEAWRRGAKLDGWDEYFDLKKWLDAFSACGIDPAFYACRCFSAEEILPWDHISCGVSKEHFLREKRNFEATKTTPSCFEKCSGCGASALMETGCCNA